MPLLNYTTTIETSKTIAEIQQVLVGHGAKQIMANYTDGGQIEALSFVIVTNEKKAIAIRLPCDAAPVLTVLQKQNVPRGLQTKDQALRVAWRIVKTWVDGQMALLETQMVKMEQIFLPYAIVKGGKTLFESLRSDNYAIMDTKIESSVGVEEGELVNN